MENKVSIVIPIRNESKYIQNLLDSISAQTTSPEEIVFIISDDDKESLHIINKWIPQSTSNIQVWHRPPNGISDARNYGSLHANESIIIHTDADCILPKDYVYNVKTFFNNNPNVECIYGKVYFINHNIWSWIFEKLYHLILPVGYKIGVHVAIGSNMAMTKKSLHNQPFNPALKFGEDNDIVTRLNGIYIPEEKVFTSNRRINSFSKIVYYIYMCIRYQLKIHSKEYRGVHR